MLKDLNYKQKSADQEIKKLYESVVFIRNDILQMKDPQNNPLLTKINERLKDLEEGFNFIKDDYKITKIKIFGNDTIDLKDLKKDLTPFCNMYSCLKSNSEKVKLVVDGVNRIQNRVENINQEVINKVKKDLNGIR